MYKSFFSASRRACYATEMDESSTNYPFESGNGDSRSNRHEQLLTRHVCFHTVQYRFDEVRFDGNKHHRALLNDYIIVLSRRNTQLLLQIRKIAK